MWILLQSCFKAGICIHKAIQQHVYFLHGHSTPDCNWMLRSLVFPPMDYSRKKKYCSLKNGITDFLLLWIFHQICFVSGSKASNQAKWSLSGNGELGNKMDSFTHYLRYALFITPSSCFSHQWMPLEKRNMQITKYCYKAVMFHTILSLSMENMHTMLILDRNLILYEL